MTIDPIAELLEAVNRVNPEQYPARWALINMTMCAVRPGVFLRDQNVGVFRALVGHLAVGTFVGANESDGIQKAIAVATWINSCDTE